MNAARDRRRPRGEDRSVPPATAGGGRLEVAEDLEFQRRDWFAQRVGWALLAALLVAALLGLTGSGPLSHATRTDGRALVVEYERFVRHGARTDWTMHVAPDGVVDGQARIRIDRRSLSAHDLQTVVPEPSRGTGRGDEVEFTFEADPRAGAQIHWSFEPDELGRHVTTVRLGDGPAVVVEQFTLP
jgi:hypothetical protein